nr:NADH dehydrogenase subunit 4 [Mytilopsis leucophaeata]
MLVVVYSVLAMVLWSFFRVGGGTLIFSIGLILSSFFVCFVGSCPMMFCDKMVLLDYLSVLMVFMSFMVVMGSLVSSCKDLFFSEKFGGKTMKKSIFGFESAILAVLVCCLGVFMSKNVFCFYLFFELSLLPTLWLVLTWGGNPERLQAGVAMMLYTVCGSIPLLMVLISSYFWFGSGEFLGMKFSLQDGLKHYGLYENIVWFTVVIGFFIKLPVFFFHSWLPQAHVEAPLAGSMLLAGVLLKLGAFGVMRFFWVLGSWKVGLFYYFFLVLSLYGGVLTSMYCLCQSDVKALIAYSSIGHMGVCLVGVMSMMSLGWSGAACLLFAHGLCSPLMFSMAGSMYQWSHSQSISVNKGMLLVFPSFGLCWIVACSLNMGFPPSLNFIGEVLLVCSGLQLYSCFGVLFGLLCFLAGAYCLHLYVSVCHGGVSMIVRSLTFLSERYIFSAFFMIFILSFGFLGLDFFVL